MTKRFQGDGREGAKARRPASIAPAHPRARASVPLTATDFYKYLTCPHWPWFDRFATAEDKKLKREFTPAEERRLDDGYLHEREVMQELAAGKEVKQLSETGDPSALFQATLAAMESGAAMIYQGTLVDGDWHGRPDLLVREEGASKLGNWHYVPLDIKASHEMKVAHRFQLVFYCFLLQRIQGVFPKKAGIINRDKEEHWIDPSTLVQDFESMLAELERIRAGEKPPLVLRKACHDTSPWGKACQHQAEMKNDIALLYNVDVRKLAGLRELGVHTVADATMLDVESLAGAAPGLTAHGLEMIKFQAQSLQNGTVFIKEPVEFPSSDYEIYFDIESDAPNDMDYLYGFLIRESPSKGKDASVRYESFVADKVKDEGKMWKAFLKWLPTLPVDYVVYHYAPYEPARLRILESRYGGSEWLEKFRSRFIDLKPIAGKNITFPLYFYGLKFICKSLGFRWTGELQSGGASIDWYERWCEVGDRDILNQIIQYNEDDVRATMFLKDWLQKYAAEVKSYDEPYPWE